MEHDEVPDRMDEAQIAFAVSRLLLDAIESSNLHGSRAFSLGITRLQEACLWFDLAAAKGDPVPGR